jgi:predicted NAD-dependent protein-ADP-ribosyltransferase YbiA (DUF1768 family)
LVKSDKHFVQIGIFEQHADQATKEISEIVSLDPFIYSFATKAFLKHHRLDPEKPASERIQERQEKHASRGGSGNNPAVEPVEPGEAIEEPLLESKERKERRQRIEKEKERPRKRIEKTIAPPEIHDVRKKYFSIHKVQDIKSLTEETNAMATKIRRSFDKTGKSWIQCFFKNDHYTIKNNEEDGDCFFNAIRDAFLSIGQETSVQKLREILVEHATEKQFHYYKNLYELHSKTSNELKISAKKIKNEYEDLQEKMNTETDRTTKLSILKKGKQLKEERMNIIKQYNSLQPLLHDIKFIVNVPNFKHFKSKLRTPHYAVDAWSMGVIEKALNIKCIVLSSANYSEGDMDSVLNCSMTTVQQLIDTEKDVDTFYEPDYYIVLDYTNCYKLISYKEKEIFTFKELPFDLREIIATKCMEEDTIYNYIPEFKKMRKPAKIVSIDKIRELCEARLYDLFDEHTTFVFHSNSRDGQPGRMPGEEIPDEEVKNFLLLNKIPHWRKKLSNEWIEPFTYDDRKWASVYHVCKASKYKSNLPKYASFSMDSGSDLSSSIELAKAVKGKEDAAFSKNKNIILQDALFAKWSLPELKHLLLETKRAKLMQFVRGSHPEPACILMNVREKLKS